MLTYYKHPYWFNDTALTILWPLITSSKSNNLNPSLRSSKRSSTVTGGLLWKPECIITYVAWWAQDKFMQYTVLVYGWHYTPQSEQHTCQMTLGLFRILVHSHYAQIWFWIDFDFFNLVFAMQVAVGLSVCVNMSVHEWVSVCVCAWQLLLLSVFLSRAAFENIIFTPCTPPMLLVNLQEWLQQTSAVTLTLDSWALIQLVNVLFWICSCSTEKQTQMKTS